MKDKRQILRSVIERTRARFPISIAEIEDQDLWTRAVIGMSYVSNSSTHAAEVLEKAVAYVMEAHPECDVLDHQLELLSLY